MAWSVLSTVDGHTTRGSFVFAIGNAPLPAVPDVGPAVSPPSPIELAGRVLSYAGIALAIGVGLFGIVVRPLLPAASAARESQLIVLAAGLLVLGPALLVLRPGREHPGEARAAARPPRAGRAGAARRAAGRRLPARGHRGPWDRRGRHGDARLALGDARFRALRFDARVEDCRPEEPLPVPSAPPTGAGERPRLVLLQSLPFS